MGKAKSVTVGYRYYLGVQLAICHGPVDSVDRLIVDERQAWSGDITTNTSVYVDAKELFGGEKSQGGVAGTMTITMGDQATQDPYLVAHCGARVPAYIGLTTAIFKSFYWSAMNPYFKAPWLRVRRILKGWSRGGAVWYSSKAVIGGRDMNPAHIVYQCLTDTEWGMGYNPTDIDEAAFTSVADTLYSESFGLSLVWDQQMALQDFIGVILNHINATLYLDLATGKFVLKLIRYNYNPATLDELNPSNVLKLESFERAGYGDLANQLTVKYTDRNQVEQTVTVQDLASIEAQGAVIATSREYLGIRTPELAIRVAQRDLNTISIPLAKVSLTVNRAFWNKVEGDVFALTWPKLGLERVVFRVTQISKGTLTDGSIKVEAVEDVFGMPSSSYAEPQPPVWTDPLQPPLPILDQRVIEAPYWEIVRSLPEDFIPSLTPGYAYALFYAARRSGMDIGFEIYSGTSAAAVQATGYTGTFEIVGMLVNEMDKVSNTVTLSGSLDFSLLKVGDYGYIDDEAVSITAINPATFTLTVTRAVLDTVPVLHVAGTKCFFSSGSASSDQEQRLSGETTYYRLLTRNGLGTLPLASSTAISAAFVGRAERPFPPGKIRISGATTTTPSDVWPTDVYGDLTVTWVHRNRVTQTSLFVGQDANNITPEPGTTYNVRVYRVSDDTLLDQITGFSGTSFTSTATSNGAARLEIESVRDGLTSWQKQSHVFNWINAGYLLTEGGASLMTEAGDHLLRG